MSKSVKTLIGFVLFIVGGLALVLSLIGVQLSYLTWIDSGGLLLGFVLRLLMILSGIVIVVLTRTNWREDEELEG
ncbi:MAG: hypothetical protein AAF960_18760 [Bacteroidota bacterium]